MMGVCILALADGRNLEGRDVILQEKLLLFAHLRALQKSFICRGNDQLILTVKNALISFPFVILSNDQVV